MTALYKQQAQRLAEHFSDVHRLRLRPTRALEAIAAIHGARDWNTLQASGAEPTAPDNGGPRAPHSRPSLFTQYRLEDAHVHESLLAEQLTVSGSSPEASAALLAKLLGYQADRGCAVVFDLTNRDVKQGQTLLSDALQAFCEQQTPVQFEAGSAATPSFEPFLGASAEQVAASVLSMLPPIGSSPGAAFYHQQASRALTVVADALLRARSAVTLRALLHHFTDARALPDLHERLPMCSQKTELEVFIQTMSKRSEFGSSIDVAAMSQSLGGVLGRLSLAVLNYGEVLSPEQSPSFDWHSALVAGQAVYVRARDNVIADWMANLLRDSFSVQLTASTPRTPTTVFIVGPGAGSFATAQFVQTANRSGVGVVILEPSAAGPMSTRHLSMRGRVDASDDDDTARLTLTELTKTQGELPRAGRTTVVEFAAKTGLPSLRP